MITGWVLFWNNIMYCCVNFQISDNSGNIFVHKPVPVCEQGEMVTLDNVTFCVHNTKGKAYFTNNIIRLVIFPYKIS